MSPEKKWITLKVKPAVEGAQILRLDEHLTYSLPAFVTHIRDGDVWQPVRDEEGNFEVRVMSARQQSLAEGIIKHNAFEVVSAEVHDE